MHVLAVPFLELEPRHAYAAWRLRQQVFVLEQACLYPDLDGRDAEPGTTHVLLLTDEGALAGYARVLDDGARWRIGRVVLDAAYRGQGLADRLMRGALEGAADRDVVLDAQSPLAGWYATFGFTPDGPEFVEDGIAHTPMRLTRR
ncbi:GNAT family N-acetyltransferase [Nocardioides sp. BP30]|uniref:GNAT family N-acetyltransferase n=1 Tax=Nocardioides sp. BP30 TaxID=3036374 RepID=UPI0024688FBA|nr:GNAT family N-acetyltransferase [Nocardioides sp. BP30]WGL52857.1 GNAT family N-acetyltransferase [Nocardioides sp. BP30]